MEKEVKISVRNLVEFVLRSGTSICPFAPMRGRWKEFSAIKNSKRVWRFLYPGDHLVR